jgi:hypothetical protein
MLDPNLRFEIVDDRPYEQGQTRSMGPGRIEPLINWLKERGIEHYWCDTWQYTWHDVEEVDTPAKHAGWENYKIYRIKVFPAQVQFISYSDFAFTKLSWQGIYRFTVSKQDATFLQEYFGER